MPEKLGGKNRPCKLGTVPWVVDVHGRDLPRLVPGEWVRVRLIPGAQWQQVYVTKVDPDGHFFADR
jgi:hypothetical protein